MIICVEIYLHRLESLTKLDKSLKVTLGLFSFADFNLLVDNFMFEVSYCVIFY